MKMRPLIMKAWSVRQIIDGFKTETRRLITPRLEKVQVGDVFWVREQSSLITADTGFFTVYAADYLDLNYIELDERFNGISWKSPIIMRKEACRLFLEVTGKRRERLQDINEAGALAEGIRDLNISPSPTFRKFYGRQLKTVTNAYFLNAIDGFISLWDNIAKPGSRWEDNPEVLVFKFRRVKK